MTTEVQNVASNVCGIIPPTVPVNIDCSLCAIGFPQAGGQISITFYGPICPPATTPSPSRWLGFEAKTAPFRCPNAGQDSELDPNKWLAVGYFASIGSGSCAQQYKWTAELTALNTDQISVKVTVYVLVPATGGNTWTSYLTWTETLTELAHPSDPTLYRGRAFASPAPVSITVNQVGGKGDPVSYAKMEVGLFSMRVGCGGVGNALPVCGLWDGFQWLTCLRGFIRSTSSTGAREFTQLGFNTASCGSVGGSICLCDTITLTATSPPAGTTTYNSDPVFVTDYGVLGLPGGIESVGAVQQLQIAAATTCNIRVVVKQVGTGTIYICTNNNGAGWVVSAATLAQSNSPHILTASRTGFDVYLYALNFPNPELLASECYAPPAMGFLPASELAPNTVVQEPESYSPPPTNQHGQQILRRMHLPCVHLGDRIDGTNRGGCGSCHQYVCAIHGQCRKIDASNEGPQCVTCPDYQAP
jgi:hypothetical protein